MAVKKFQTQDGFKLNAGDAIVDSNDNPILFHSEQFTTTISAGENANSPYWTSLVNGWNPPAATVVAVAAPVEAPPIITITDSQPLPNSTRVEIVGALGMTGLNGQWYVKSTVNPNDYELYTNYDLTTFTDLSGEDPYETNSASLSYLSYNAHYTSVAHDSQGNVIAAGYTDTENVDQVVIGKYGPTGTNLWLQVLADPAYNLDGWGLSVDSDNNILLCVNDQSKILVAKLSGADGSIIWQTGITSSTGEYGYALELAADGNPVIAGRIFNDTNGTNDFLVAKVSADNGSLVWSKSIDLDFYQSAYSLACDSHGHVIVVGYSSTPSNDVILMAVMNQDGDLLNSHIITGYNNYGITGVDTAVDSNDNVYISATGSTDTNEAAFLIKIDLAGTIAWTRMIGPGNCYTTALSLAMDGDDRILMLACNGQDDYNIPQFDMVIGCYDPDGNPLWQRYWGDSRAWEIADSNPGAGQMLSVFGDYMAVGGWFWRIDTDSVPVGNASAMVSQLPKDGSLISIGPQRMRPSRFTGQFVSLESYSFELPTIDNPMNQSSSSMVVEPGLLVRKLVQDFPGELHTWTFGSDSNLSLPGGLSVAATPWAEDIWIGEEVYFTKTNYGDEVDPIDEDVSITRGNQNGIYNIDQEESYSSNVSPAGTLWNGDGWSDLSNVVDRDYQVWRNTVYPPNAAIGRELVMHDTTNNKYYTVKFLSWQSNAYGGGFSYVRRQINVNAYFSKTSSGSEIDEIAPGLSLTRGNYGIIYNPAAGETEYNSDYSPLNTLWNGDGWTNLHNLQSREWLSFYYIMGGQNVGRRVMGREWIMWDTNNNEYYAIKFSLWQPGNNGGAFSYVRRKINKSSLTHGIAFPDGSVQTEAWDKTAAGVLPQVRYTADDDLYLNIEHVGKHVYIAENGTSIYLTGIGDQPYKIGSTITIVNRSGGNIYLYKDNSNENGTIYGAGTSDSSTSWIIPDSGGGNICTLMLTDIYGYDYVTVDWILSGPGIQTN